MNILFVNNFQGRGGGEEFLRDLLPGLINKGLRVGLVCRPDTPLAGLFRGSKVKVYPIRRSGVGALTSVFKIARIIRNNKYEIVNIQRGHDIIQSCVASWLSFTNPVLTYTAQVPEFMKSRFLLNRMDRILTISRYIADKIADFAPSTAKKTNIIYYGIDLSKFNSGPMSLGWFRSRFGLSAGTKIIATVGDLWKNQIEFLDALDEIRKAYPEVKYVLVASETGIGQIKEFKEYAAKRGLTDSVIWAGRLSKEDVPLFYADIDIAVSTHRNEGFGIWVLEALAMGKPVLAYNAGGIRDSLEGCPAGVLVDGGPHNMAAAILSILRNDAVRNQMSVTGPHWIAERFSRERMVEDYFKLYHTLIAKRNSPGET